MKKSIWLINILLICALGGVWYFWTQPPAIDVLTPNEYSDSDSKWEAPTYAPITVPQVAEDAATAVSSKDLFEKERKQIKPKVEFVTSKDGPVASDLKLAVSGVYLFETSSRAVIRGNEPATQNMFITVEARQVIDPKDYDPQQEKIASTVKGMTVDHITEKGVLFIEENGKKHFVPVDTTGFAQGPAPEVLNLFAKTPPLPHIQRQQQKDDSQPSISRLKPSPYEQNDRTSKAIKLTPEEEMQRERGKALLLRSMEQDPNRPESTNTNNPFSEAMKKRQAQQNQETLKVNRDIFRDSGRRATLNSEQLQDAFRNIQKKSEDH